MPTEAALSSAVPSDRSAQDPGLDRLEAFRQKHWGKRDTWAWLMGFLSVVELLFLLALIPSGRDEAVWDALLLVQAAVLGCYFFGLRWTRWAVFPVGLVFLAIPYFDTRNRLFFRVEVTREALQKAWRRYCDNTQALIGFILGILSVLFGGFAPFALIVSIAGLAQANPNANPPIGRRGLAIAGILLSIAGMALWGVLAFLALAASATA